MDLHPKAGQHALAEAGLLDEFKKHARPEGEAMKLVKFDGSVLWDENEMGNMRPDEFADRPEIDRVVLRDILLDSLLPGTIKWGQKLAKVEPDAKAEGKYTLIFTDYSTETGIDLVVGADGAWSKVRPLLTEEKPFYSGITAIELWALDVEKTNPWLSKYVGNGSCFMFDEGRSLLCQRNGNGSIRAYASVRLPESWSDDCGIDWTKPNSARKQLVEKYFGDCGEDVKRKESVVAKVFSDKSNIVAAIQEYEVAMFEMGEANAKKTAQNMEKHFSKDGAEERAGFFMKHREMMMAAEAEGTTPGH